MDKAGGLKDKFFAVVAGLVMLGFLSLAAVYTADIYYKAGWIVSHFPPQGTLCTSAFCLRTDTVKPPSEFMRMHFPYCPQHLQSGFQGRGGRSQGVIIYMALFMTLLSFLSVPIVGALFRIAAWPVLIPMRLAGKLPPGRLIPFKHDSESEDKAFGDGLEKAGMWTGAVLALAAIILYCWF